MNSPLVATDNVLNLYVKPRLHNTTSCATG